MARRMGGRSLRLHPGLAVLPRRYDASVVSRHPSHASRTRRERVDTVSSCAMRNLRDMVIVITGASAGIGKALAQHLSARGGKLVLSARRAEMLDQLNASLGGKHLVVRADVSKADECQMLISKSIEHFGRIDTLVCNAGYGL